MYSVVDPTTVTIVAKAEATAVEKYHAQGSRKKKGTKEKKQEG